jgi:hypothetical protein
MYVIYSLSMFDHFVFACDDPIMGWVRASETRPPACIWMVPGTMVNDD